MHFLFMSLSCGTGNPTDKEFSDEALKSNESPRADRCGETQKKMYIGIIFL